MELGWWQVLWNLRVLLTETPALGCCCILQGCTAEVGPGYGSMFLRFRILVPLNEKNFKARLWGQLAPDCYFSTCATEA